MEHRAPGALHKRPRNDRAHLEIYGPAQDIHSGAVSGPAPNPIVELCELIAGLQDAHGKITLPHFYDSVEDVSAGRRQELADLWFDEDDWLRRSHTRRIVGEEGYSVLERLWARPSLEVIRESGGDQGDTPRAVIPAMAEADISIRTVSNQTSADVAEQLRAFVATHFPDPSRYSLEISEDTAQEPYVTPEHPAVDALTRAIAAGHDVADVGRMGNAGGGPAELRTRIIGAPVVFYGTGLVDDNWHDSDERPDRLAACRSSNPRNTVGRTGHVVEERSYFPFELIGIQASDRRWRCCPDSVHHGGLG